MTRGERTKLPTQHQSPVRARAAVPLLCCALLTGVAAAQDTAQPAPFNAQTTTVGQANQAPLPVAPPAAPAIQTAQRTLRQPPIAAAPDLPFEPQPQQPSLLVTQGLAGAAPRDLGHGVKTPVSTGSPINLSLADAVNLGLERSLRISVDQQRERQVAGLRSVAFNALIPTLTAVGRTSTQQVNLAAMGFSPAAVQPLLPPGTPPLQTIVRYDVTSAQLNLNQQLFNLPAYEVYKAAREQAKIATLQTYSDRGEIVQDVATQYLRVLADEASIRDAEGQLVSDRELERQAQARKDAGTGTNLDLLRARVTRQQREQQLVQLRNSLDKDKIQLNRNMGLAADQPLVLTDPVPYHELDALPLETARQVAYKRRKDLLGLEAQLRSAELQRKAIAYERLPAATLGGYYGVIGQTHGLYHGDFVAQGGINFPIFEEARIRGDREVADSQLTRLRAQIRSVRADIDQQIRSSMLDVQTADDLVKAATSNVNLAAEALSDAQQRYRAGVDDTLPVVRAQATLVNAQSQLVNALFQFNQAKLQLARNTGVLESQYDSYLNQ
ncbi:TolC family protein [Terriglobus aquaticus]|uniref:TolC family protein n=1 Tax=Terriglobus aquaticus TaxID=940139 RepID=A0ABW9KMS6_9BACT|nr:TolC family protein [Terriglobus aquaticus]